MGFQVISSGAKYIQENVRTIGGLLVSGVAVYEGLPSLCSYLTPPPIPAASQPWWKVWSAPPEPTILPSLCDEAWQVVLENAPLLTACAVVGYGIHSLSASSIPAKIAAPISLEKQASTLLRQWTQKIQEKISQITDEQKRKNAEKAFGEFITFLHTEFLGKEILSNAAELESRIAEMLVLSFDKKDIAEIREIPGPSLIWDALEKTEYYLNVVNQFKNVAFLRDVLEGLKIRQEIIFDLVNLGAFSIARELMKNEENALQVGVRISVIVNRLLLAGRYQDARTCIGLIRKEWRVNALISPICNLIESGHGSEALLFANLIEDDMLVFCGSCFVTWGKWAKKLVEKTHLFEAGEFVKRIQDPIVRDNCFMDIADMAIKMGYVSKGVEFINLTKASPNRDQQLKFIVIQLINLKEFSEAETLIELIQPPTERKMYKTLLSQAKDGSSG